MHPTKELKLRIGDITFSLISEDNFPCFEVDDVYQDFVTEDKPEVILSVRYAETAKEYNFGKKIFDSGSAWSFYRRDGKYLLSICYSGKNSPPDKMAILEPDFSFGEVYISNHWSGQPIVSDPLGYPLGELLMINLLSLDRGALCHGCGVSEGGQGILFAGSSGAGKSTLANLYRERKDVSVLSDDRIVIRKHEGRFWIYGTPWHGDAKVCSPKEAHLEKIFFLQQARKNKVKKIDLIKAASRLIVSSFLPFWDKKGMEFTLNFCAELAQKIPCYVLDFIPDKRVLDLVKSI